MFVPDANESTEFQEPESAGRERAYHGETAEPLPAILQHVPRWMRFENSPIEATGLNVDIYARGTIIMSSLFLGPALLQLATESAYQACSDSGRADCNENPRIFGFRPSSLLANIAVASGLLCSILLPVFGAIVDHTPFRRQVGAVTAVALVCCKAAEIMVGKRTWFLVALTQVASGALFIIHTSANYAYTAEVSNDAALQAAINTRLFITLYISSLVFMALVLAPSHLFDLGDVGTARVSQTVTSTISAGLFYFSWTFLFRDRPALRRVPDGMSLLGCGFRKVTNSMRRIRTHFPALLRLMTAVAFAEAATAALISIATTYMKNVLEMNAAEIGGVFLVVLTCGIPGNKIAAYLASRLWNPIHNLLLCHCLFIVSISTAGLFLTGPEVKHRTWVFALSWGVGLGWLHPIEISTYISLIENGQEAEMMSIYLLLGQILTWLPPLTFTILNENGVPMAYGLGSLSIFFLIASLSLPAIGKYEDAINALNAVDHDGAARELNASDHEVVEFKTTPII
jgi:MFS transporter, UMF1 family